MINIFDIKVVEKIIRLERLLGFEQNLEGKMWERELASEIDELRIQSPELYRLLENCL